MKISYLPIIVVAGALSLASANAMPDLGRETGKFIRTDEPTPKDVRTFEPAKAENSHGSLSFLAPWRPPSALAFLAPWRPPSALAFLAPWRPPSALAFLAPWRPPSALAFLAPWRPRSTLAFLAPWRPPSALVFLALGDRKLI